MDLFEWTVKTVFKTGLSVAGRVLRVVAAVALVVLVVVELVIRT